MKDQLTIKFDDLNSGDEGVILVRRTSTGFGLAISLVRDGDIEVFIDRPTTVRLIQALSEIVNDQIGE